MSTAEATRERDAIGELHAENSEHRERLQQKLGMAPERRPLRSMADVLRRMDARQRARAAARRAALRPPALRTYGAQRGAPVMVMALLLDEDRAND